MYDVVIVGRGLTGLLSAIWSKKFAEKVAVVAQGTGKVVQSTGLFDITPGNEETENPFIKTDVAEKAVAKFKELMKQLDYPYQGSLEKPVPVVTGAGFVKYTTLYPETITPVPSTGHVVIVGFEEIADFQPAYVKGNLQTERPELNIDTIKVRLGEKSLRTLTQNDAARLLDRKEIRNGVIKQIKSQMAEKNIEQPRLFIFPASLGIANWREAVQDFHEALGTPVTEAPGMPPNATAIRLEEKLTKEAIRLGIRFYLDTEVTGSTIEDNKVVSLTIKNNSKVNTLKGANFIIAGGGVLGGGLTVTSKGLKDSILGLDVDEFGRYKVCPENVIPAGATLGTKMLKFGITGGIFSIQSGYESCLKLEEYLAGGIIHA